MQQAPPPQPHLKPAVYVIAGVGVFLIVGALVYVPSLMHMPTLSLPAPETTVPQSLPLPEDLTRPMPTYGQVASVAPAPKPPVAEYLPRGSMPSAAPTTPAAPQVVQQAIVPPWMNPFAAPAPQLAPDAQTPPSGQAAPATPPHGAQGTTQKPEKKGWGFLAKGKDRTERTPAEEGKKTEIKTTSEANDLIKPAKWAIPVSPLRTLYRSMQLPARTLDTIVSDIPGMVRLELVVPIYDRFHYDTVILPKNTIIVATQEGTPSYGMSRIPLKIEQAELETGEVLSFKATVGDSEGGQGLPGKTNNHIGKVILATGLSAILNIGARSIAGQPTGFNYDIGQETAREVGQGVQRDSQSIIDRELRIKPTITVKSGTFCTIQLGENIQLNRPPLVIR